MLPAISGIRCELESVYSDVTALEISVFTIQSTAAETAAFPQEYILRVTEGAGRAAVRSAALRCGGRSDSRCRSAERRAVRPLGPAGTAQLRTARSAQGAACRGWARISVPVLDSCVIRDGLAMSVLRHH